MSACARVSFWKKRREQLVTLAEVLLEKEVLTERDLVEVLGERPFKRQQPEPPGVNAEGEQATTSPSPSTNGDPEPPSPGGDGAVQPSETRPSSSE
jgi:hypothetical protein